MFSEVEDLFRDPSGFVFARGGVLRAQEIPQGWAILELHNGHRIAGNVSIVAVGGVEQLRVQVGRATMTLLTRSVVAAWACTEDEVAAFHASSGITGLEDEGVESWTPTGIEPYANTSVSTGGRRPLRGSFVATTDTAARG